MMVSLDNFIKIYNDDQRGILIKSKTHPDGNYSIVACNTFNEKNYVDPEAEKFFSLMPPVPLIVLVQKHSKF